MIAAVAKPPLPEMPVKRFEVTAYDYRVRKRVTIAWSDDEQLAGELALGAEACPTMSDGKVVDHGETE